MCWPQLTINRDIDDASLTILILSSAFLITKQDSTELKQQI
jgi:hypothetical protein